MNSNNTLSNLSLETLLGELDETVRSTIDTLPDVGECDGSFEAEDIPDSGSTTWVKLPEVVAVVCDLKSSTHLGTGRHDKSTARIYTSAVDGAVRIFHDFEADFIDIQGDGGFGLYWGDKAYERALCAAVTIRTFSGGLVERLEKNWKGLNEVATGYKVGIHAGRVLVKKLGTQHVVSEQEPVWAGKPVNYAAKCAQSAERHQVVVTQPVWEKLKTNDYIAYSCDCNGGPAASLWADKKVETLPADEQDTVVLDSGWCPTCGPEFCQAILDEKKTRESVTSPVRNQISRMKVNEALEYRAQRGSAQRVGLSKVRRR